MNDASHAAVPCLLHTWVYRPGTYYGERVVFTRCRYCKRFRIRMRSGHHLERVKATWTE